MTLRWLFCLFALIATPATARDLATGLLPLKVDAVTPIGLAADEELQIEGTVTASAAVIVVLRIDDMQSWSYASRFNGERMLPPGPFQWTIGAKGLRSPSGRTLDHAQLRRLIFFIGKGEGSVTITRLEIAKSARLPAPAKGYSLGGTTAEIPSGFERILPGDPRVEGTKVFAVRRPAPDPLLASGVRGIERLRLPWADGRARVTVWTEDPGEWELLPHPLQRRIRVNGAELLFETLTPQEWVERRYLRGSAAEHGADDDAWTAFGRWRGEARTLEVEPGPDGIVIELAGSGAEALYLSAVLIEPAGSNAAFDQVQAARAQWYRSNWPVVAAPRVGHTVSVALPATGTGVPSATPSLRSTAAAGTGARLTVAVVSDETIPAPLVELQLPTLGQTRLNGLLWAAQSRLERRQAGDTVLTLTDNMLAGSGSRPPLIAGRARTYEMWFSVPADAAVGLYRGAFAISGGARQLTVPVEIEVLAVSLPPASKAAGYYLDEVPHLSWFATMTPDRSRQTACDLTFMARLGLTGSAPALATPKHEAGAFEADMRRAAAAGTTAPWLAYAPAKRLRERLGAEGSAGLLARLERDLVKAGLTPPLWSVADEPSNPDQPEDRLRAWVTAIRTQAPGAKLAGHLNTPKDRALLSMFDAVLLNAGYGLDPATLHEAAADDREVWLYNTAHPRVSAGLWLWKTPARRYLQWHGRMPTADPFDPTDGREGDVQALLPMSEVCPAVPSIHSDLLDMAEGVVDQRWLAWLDTATSEPARALRDELRNRFALRWKDAAALSSVDLQRMRESIIQASRVTH